MDWNRIEGSWHQLKGKIKEHWGHLTDDDLDKIGGKREQLEGKIQERYGWTKDVVRTDRQLDEKAAVIESCRTRANVRFECTTSKAA